MNNEKACIVGNDNRAIKWQRRSAKSYEIAREMFRVGNLDAASIWQLIAALEAREARAYYDNMMLVTL